MLPMGYVVAFSVAVFLSGVVFLVLLGLRAYRQVKALGAKVSAASARIADASAALETVAPRER
jgi:hypothetical protein